MGKGHTMQSLLIKLFLVLGILSLLASSAWGANTASFKVNNASIQEGDSGTSNIVFSVSIRGYCRKNTTYSIDWSTSDGTATTADNDYQSSNGTASYRQPNYTIESGACSTITVSIPVYGDTTVENDEIFYVTLSNPTSSSPNYGADISDNRARGTIADDDSVNYGLSNERPFTEQFNANDFGDITLIGNTILCKSTEQSSSYKTGSCEAPVYSDSNDDIYTLYHVLSSDNNDSSIFNSSSADLTIPAGSTVLWATLYWQGGINSNTIATTTGDPALTDMTAAMTRARTVKFKVPGTSSYVDITSKDAKFNWNRNSSTYNYYQGAQEVTALVQQSGSYQVANIIANDGDSNGGTGPYGGWALMVVYQDNTSSLKNLVVYDGYKLVRSDISTTLSGFYTPTSGDVASKFTMFAAEADSTRSDTILMSDTSNSNQTVATNELDSSIKDTNGASVTARTPDYANTIGIDIHTWDVGNTAGAKNIIGNGQSSTNVTFQYGSDIYNLGLFAFSTDLYQPEVCYYEKVYYDGVELTNGASVNYGDAVNVQVYIKNDGQDTAEKVKIYRDFDTQLPYVGNSTLADNSIPTYGGPYNNLAQKSDALDSDTFDYNTSSDRYSIHLGTGATSILGGNLLTGEGAYFEYNVTVEVNETTSLNYNVAYTNAAINFDYDGMMNKCVDFNNSFYGWQSTPPVGNADMIDIFTSTANYNNGNDQYIQTKVAAAQGVTLTGVHLNPAGEAEPFNSPNQRAFLIMPYLSDETCTEQTTVYDMVGDPFIIRLSHGETAKSGQAKIPNLATREARFKIAYLDLESLYTKTGDRCYLNSSLTGNLDGLFQCANSEKKYKAAFGENAAQRCLVNNGKPCQSNHHGYSCGPNDKTCSGYNAQYDNNYGCLMCTLDSQTVCSSDNFAIRPERFELDLTTLSPTDPFDLLRAGNDYTLDLNAHSMNVAMLTPGYDQNGTNLSYGGLTRMPNGDLNASLEGAVSVNDGYSFSDGKATAFAFTFDDVGRITLDVNDTEWTSIDSGDTPFADRLITGEANVTFIPWDFNISAAVLTNHADANFSYLSNDFNMSATIPLTIQARNKHGGITRNYADSLYEKPISMQLDAYATIIDKVAISQTVTDADLDFSAGAAQIASNDTEVIRFNFTRQANVPVNPFTVTGADVNVSVTDTDGVNGKRTQSADGNVTFYYGRLHAPRYRFNGNGGNAQLYYEIYCSTTTATNPCVLADHSEVLGNTPQLSVDDIRWYQNPAHTGTNFGDFSATINPRIPALQAVLTKKDRLDFESAEFTYNAKRGYPFKASMMVIPDDWLLFHRFDPNPTYNEMMLEFHSQGRWQGNTQSASKVNTAPATNTARRIDW